MSNKKNSQNKMAVSIPRSDDTNAGKNDLKLAWSVIKWLLFVAKNDSIQQKTFFSCNIV